MRKPELLIPASSLEVLKIAVIYGADAVYIGGEVFSLRAKAKNFSMIYSFCLKERFCWAVYRENTQKTKMPDICCLAKKRIKKARKIA